MSLAASNNQEEASCYAMNSFHTGIQSQIVENSNVKYKCLLPELEDVSLYPWQVTGVATMLLAIFGYILQRPDALGSTREAAKSPKGLKSSGMLACDQTSMDTSLMTLVTSFCTRFHQDFDESGTPVYGIMHLSVPVGVIKQWVNEVIAKFPEIHLIVSYDDDSALDSSRYEKYFITAKVVKNWGNIEYEPERYRYIFDKKSPKTA
ncbi:hypothetical protein FB567DRAFT_554350 [Paraphoma chrysanthemicola]|uniref:Uncharacterized protein n=1 Tax=Paraphoma chrysanthemicola TaxID=798071 RepID=A0A8K0QUC2_9PLEO|nr:hypothetical protein FB567DRAFT_554350 [Paraphoma chrysanthemicola]